MNTRAKLLILILILGVFMGAYLQLVSLPRALDQAERRVHESLTRHMASIANGLVPLVKEGRSEEIRRQLDAVLKGNRNFLNLQLLDTAGNELYPRNMPAASEHRSNHNHVQPSKDPHPMHGGDSRPAPSGQVQGDRHLVHENTAHMHKQPVIDRGVPIGELVLTKSLETEFQGIRAAYWNFLAALMTAVLVALAAVTVLVRTEAELSKKSALLDELHQQKSLFEAIFNHVPDALVIATEDRKIRMCNPGVTRMFGYAPHELITKSTALLYESEEEFDRLGRLRHNIHAEEKLTPDEVNFRRENGEVFPAETVGTVIKAADGRPIGLLGLIRDITERKQAEHGLRERTERLEGLIRTSAKVAGTIETNETLNAIAKEAANLLGVGGAGFRLLEQNGLVVRGSYGLAQKVMLRPSIPVGESLTGQVAQEGRAIAVADLRSQQHFCAEHQKAAMAHGVIAYLGVPLRYRDRIIGVLNVYAKEPHFFPEEEVNLLRAFADQAAIAIEKARLYDQTKRHAEELQTEVAERKQAEAELEQSRHHNEQILNSAGEGIYGLDLEGRTTFINPAAARMVGWKPEELIGKPQHAILHHTRPDGTPYPREECPIYAAFRDGSAHHVDNEVFWRKDGTSFPVEYISTPIREHGKPVGAVVSFRDITERKRAETERDKLHRQLVDASRQAGQAEIATGVLHNVGNVLNSVNVSATLVADKIRESKVTNLAKASQLLHAHADDLARFLTEDKQGKQLPAYLATLAAHLESERQTMLTEFQSITDNISHIKQIVGRQQSYASNAGVTQSVVLADLLDDALSMNVGERHEIEVVREYDAVPVVTVDKHKLLQIIVNLVRNAKQALNEYRANDKQIVLRIKRVGPERIRIAVTDNGVGISADNLARLFEYGFTTKEDGHGFGLHVSANTAKELGGALTGHSDGPGKGASFTLELPFAVKEQAA